MIDHIIDIDKRLFIFLNNLGSEKWDFLWLFFSNNIVMFSFITFIIVVHCYEFEIKKWGTLILFFVICVGLTDFLHVQLFKNLFMRLRPCHEDGVCEYIRYLEEVDCGGYYGFISGHASNSAAMVTFLLLAFTNIRKFFRYILVFWVLLVSYSRIYLAKHYPFDVVFGILFGCLMGLVIFKTYNVYFNKYR
mgnify:CR=1 FL=1